MHIHRRLRLHTWFSSSRVLRETSSSLMLKLALAFSSSITDFILASSPTASIFSRRSCSELHTYMKYNLIYIHIAMDSPSPVSHIVLRSLQLGHDIVGIVNDTFLFLNQVRQRLQLHFLAIGLLALFIQLLCSVRKGKGLCKNVYTMR